MATKINGLFQLPFNAIFFKMEIIFLMPGCKLKRTNLRTFVIFFTFFQYVVIMSNFYWIRTFYCFQITQPQLGYIHWSIMSPLKVSEKSIMRKLEANWKVILISLVFNFKDDIDCLTRLNTFNRKINSHYVWFSKIRGIS